MCMDDNDSHLLENGHMEGIEEHIIALGTHGLWEPFK